MASGDGQLPRLARRISSMYTDDVLGREEERLAPAIRTVYDEEVLPMLLPEERRLVADVVLDLPRRAPENEPFAFMVDLENRRIVLSLVSLKFLVDVIVANLRLQRYGHNLATVDEYLAMLKYSDALGSDLSALRPPVALGVADAPPPDETLDYADGMTMTSTISFILLHELGHIILAHGDSSPLVDAIRRNEVAADAFALDTMARAGTPPTGAFLFFMKLSRLENQIVDFDTPADYFRAIERRTHPLTPARIGALAANLLRAADAYAFELEDGRTDRALYVALSEQIAKMARLQEDARSLEIFRQLGQGTTPAWLAPREADGLLGAPGPAPAPGSGLVGGLYRGETMLSDMAARCDVWLEESGGKVSGMFNYGPDRGTLSGFVEKDTLTLLWRMGKATGRASLVFDRAADAFTGCWGLDASGSNWGAWCGSRGSERAKLQPS